MPTLKYNKYAMLLFMGIMLGTFVQAQDLIILKNGDDIKAKVLEINNTQIKFRIFDDLSGTEKFIETSKVILIRYEDGTNFIISDKTNNNTQTNEVTYQSSDELKKRAVSDAQMFYDPTVTQCGVGCISAAFLPVGAAFTMLVAAVEPPGFQLNMPSRMNGNTIYTEAYKAEAFKIKKRKVWRIFGIMAVIELPIYSFIIINQIN